MSVLLTIWRELISLFIDDGALAIQACAWVAVAGLLLPLFLGLAAVGVLLFLGLGVILAASVSRA